MQVAGSDDYAELTLRLSGYLKRTSHAWKRHAR